MTIEDFIERDLRVDTHYLILDEYGNEYHNEDGGIEYLEPSKLFKPGKPITLEQAGILPTFKGWTVDYQLRQFRKAGGTYGFRFEDFDSDIGDSLLSELITYNLVPMETLRELF